MDAQHTQTRFLHVSPDNLCFKLAMLLCSLSMLLLGAQVSKQRTRVEPCSTSHQVSTNSHLVSKASRIVSAKDRKFQTGFPLVPLPWRRRPALLPLSRLGICSSDLKQMAGLDRALKKSCINLIDFDS